MKKSVRAYYLVLVVILSPIIIAAGWELQWLFSAVVFVLALWWSVYFLRLRYTYTDGILRIESGLFFRRVREIQSDNILWVTRVELLFSRRASASVLHTAGGVIVIFCEFSTQS